MRTPKEIQALDAVVATTTSNPIDVTDAKRVALLLTRADHSAGSSTFTILGSIDGISGTYTALNSIIQDLTNTNAQNYTRVASIAPSSNASILAALDLEQNCFTHIKIKVTEVTGGTHSAKVLVKY